MQLREVSYLVQIRAEKARQQMEAFDKGFDQMIQKTGVLDSALQRFGTSAIQNLMKARSGVDSLKKSMNSIKDSKGVVSAPTATKMNNMKKASDNAKLFATSMTGASKAVSRLNKQLTETDKLMKSLKEGSASLKSNLNTTRAPRIGGGSSGGGKAGGGGKGAPQSSNFLAYSAQQHPLMSAIYRGMGMSTLLHFGGVGAGFMQMGAQKVTQLAQESIQKIFQSANEGSDYRKGMIEAGAVTETFLTNKAEEIGRDPEEINDIAKANAKAFAQNTVFNRRQALIAQAGLVEGGMDIDQATSMKAIGTVLDRTIARYNKVDVSEQNIQTFINQLATASTSGKVGRLAFFRQEGADWMSKFESAKPEERWNMMLSAMEKSSDGLADTIANADKVLTLSILQTNRKEAVFSGHLGRLGMEFDTLKTSITTNAILPMEAFMATINKLAREVNNQTAPKEELREQIGKRFGVSSTDMQELRNLKTQKQQERHFQTLVSDKVRENTTRFTPEMMDEMVGAYFDPEKSVGQRIAMKDKIKEMKIQSDVDMESLDFMDKEAQEITKEANISIKSLMKSFDEGEKVYKEAKDAQLALTKATEALDISIQKLTEKGINAEKFVQSNPELDMAKSTLKMLGFGGEE